MINIYDDANNNNWRGYTRSVHAKPARLISTNLNVPYLNKDHWRLVNKIEDLTQEPKSEDLGLISSPTRGPRPTTIERHSLSFFQTHIDTQKNFTAKITGCLLGTLLGVGAGFLITPCVLSLHIVSLCTLAIALVLSGALLGYFAGKMLGNWLGDCIGDNKPLFRAPTFAI